jgi:formate hydrogenlyase subunit 3/multisubunit Na+/H+ antiporter MnhD subunit
LVVVPLLPPRGKGWGNALFVLANAILTSVVAIQALCGNPLEQVISGFGFLGAIPLRVDALAAWFILIINFTSLTGAVYGIGYMKPYGHQARNLSLHWVNFLLFQASMIWVCIVQNTLVFLIAWELMSISSLLLVLFDHQNNHTLKAGLNYLIQMHVGVVLLTAAFIWVYIAEGSMDFLAIKGFFTSNPNLWLFLILFAGFGVKAGFIPLHTWLPHAHPAAPSHVSGVMSGVIVKMGIYGILRVVTYLQHDITFLGRIVLVLSVITGLYGIINSAVHRDYKRMLAYCTIENIGIIGSGIGLGMIGLGKSNEWLVLLGFGGALLHTLNHSLFKSLLFFSAGSVYQQTHTRDMEKLGGLIKNMPQTAMLFLLGALAIGGLPPFNGFISEFVLYSGFIKGMANASTLSILLMVFALAGLSVIGGISIYAFTKSFGVIFLGTPRTHLHSEPTEVPLIMRLPQYIIIGVMLSIAFVPAFYFKMAAGVVHTGFGLATSSLTIDYSGYVGVLLSVGQYALLFVGVIVLIMFARSTMVKRLPESVSATWGCGYVAPKPSMQYTGKSFSKTMGKLLSSVVHERKRYHEIVREDVFPAPRTHSAFYTDFFEFRVIDRVVTRLLSFMNLFQFVQNGLLQRYILYGFLFILLIFLMSVLSLI